MFDSPEPEPEPSSLTLLLYEELNTTFAAAEDYLNDYELSDERFVQHLMQHTEYLRFPLDCLFVWLSRYKGNKRRAAGLVQCYIDAGMSVHPPYRTSQLFQAMRDYPDPAVIECLLHNGANFRHAPHPYALKAILKASDTVYAVLKRYWDDLVTAGLNVNAPLDQSGQTLMHRFLHIPQYMPRMLDMGCNPDLPDASGLTPAMALANLNQERERRDRVSTQHGAKHPLRLRPNSYGYSPRLGGQKRMESLYSTKSCMNSNI